MGKREQQERLAYLIERLIAEEPQWVSARVAGELPTPDVPQERFRMYRSLVNMRQPRPVDAAYIQVEDAYLQEALRERGAVTLDEVRRASTAAGVPGLAACDGAAAGGGGEAAAGDAVAGGDRAAGSDAAADGGAVASSCASGELLLWQGDITRLALDGIVNAANAALLGCRAPCHDCIDNAIHTAAGVQLRLACDELMRAQGSPEAAGRAKITPGFNLPASHVLHTVGPIVQGSAPTARNCADLASCYRSCLDLAAAHGLGSIAFCCISTGEFRFPKREAARIAVREVRLWMARARSVGAGRSGSAGASTGADASGRAGAGGNGNPAAGGSAGAGSGGCAGTAADAGAVAGAGENPTIVSSVGVDASGRAAADRNPAAGARAGAGGSAVATAGARANAGAVAGAGGCAGADANAGATLPVVVFNVFTDDDLAIYQEILAGNKT